MAAWVICVVLYARFIVASLGFIIAQCNPNDKGFGGKLVGIGVVECRGDVRFAIFAWHCYPLGMQQPVGKVYLIGAGPGDPGLLTLKGAQCIAEADTLVYDRLIHPRVLDHAQPSAERIYVGKRPDHHTISQDEINQVLIDRARAGKIVARIKGGDPFVFGRGGEEALALQAAGVAFEVVPGVTSAIAAAAYAGIPVTHRQTATSFAVITGHEAPSKPESSINWEHLATGVDTLVFLMGVGLLGEIAGKLIDNGLSASTPAAVIEWGTYPAQRTVTATLATIQQESAIVGIGAPAVIIVGDVVTLREKIHWFENKPLFGKRILVTRPEEQASKFTAKLEALGAAVIELPTISCVPLEETPELDSAIEDMPHIDWVVFTSVNGVSSLLQRLRLTNRDIRSLAGPKIAAIGESTADALQALGLRVDFCPSEFKAETFVDEFPSSDPQRILLVRADEGRDVIPDGLTRLGHQVMVAPVYRTVMAETSADQLSAALDEGIDFVTFTSSSTVKNFVQILGERATLDCVKIVSIGPITSATARKHGLTVHAEARVHTIDGLVEAILTL